jgi:hypothetical protein
MDIYLQYIKLHIFSEFFQVIYFLEKLLLNYFSKFIYNPSGALNHVLMGISYSVITLLLGILFKNYGLGILLPDLVIL